MRRLAVILPLVGFLLGQDGRRSLPIPADIARDAYELYSAIYRQGARCESLQPGEMLIISRDAADLPGHRAFDELLKPKSEEDRAMIRELIRLNGTPHLWNSGFDFGRPYRMVTDKQGQIALDCGDRRDAKGRCAPYANVYWVRFFSVPSFNADHTRALVFTSRGVRGFGGAFEFTEYRKTAVGWQLEEHSFAVGCVKI